MENAFKMEFFNSAKFFNNAKKFLLRFKKSSRFTPLPFNKYPLLILLKTSWNSLGILLRASLGQSWISFSNNEMAMAGGDHLWVYVTTLHVCKRIIGFFSTKFTRFFIASLLVLKASSKDYGHLRHLFAKTRHPAK